MHKQQDILSLEEGAEITALAQAAITCPCKIVTQDPDII